MELEGLDGLGNSDRAGCWGMVRVLGADSESGPWRREIQGPGCQSEFIYKNWKKSFLSFLEDIPV